LEDKCRSVKILGLEENSIMEQSFVSVKDREAMPMEEKIKSRKGFA
jgi:hypothetical protein